MPARHRFTRRSVAVRAALLIALAALPIMASARTIYDARLLLLDETGGLR